MEFKHGDVITGTHFAEMYICLRVGGTLMFVGSNSSTFSKEEFIDEGGSLTIHFNLYDTLREILHES